jgi:Ca2+-binding EF-hand superfamily protein
VVTRAVNECDKNHDGKITKEEMNSWLVKYMKTHEHYSHEHPVMLKKMTSIKAE